MDEIERVRNQMDHSFDKILEGCWMALRKEGARYVGRVVGAKTKEEALKLPSRVVLLNPCFEMIIQLQQNQGMLGKTPIIIPPGMMGNRVDVRITDPSEMIFFEDMTESDLDLHKALVKEGLVSLKSTRLGDTSELQSRILPPNAPVPNGGRRG